MPIHCLQPLNPCRVWEWLFRFLQLQLMDPLGMRQPLLITAFPSSACVSCPSGAELWCCRNGKVSSGCSLHFSWPHRRNWCRIQPKSAKSTLTLCFPHGTLKPPIPVSSYSSDKSGLCSQLPGVMVGAALGVPQPASELLFSQACLAQQAALFLQEQVETSQFINQSFC